MAKKYQSGQLVEVLADQVASYSDYGGRPPISFRKGMLGVVRVHHECGVQVEYFSPETGLMEACHCGPEILKKLKWPDGLVNLHDKYVLYKNEFSTSAMAWYSCGSLGPFSAINYLKAVALQNRAYFDELHVQTLRIPGYHTSRLRTVEPIPQCFLAMCAGGGSYLRASEIMIELDMLHRQSVITSDTLLELSA